ncbi:MAG: T9SS type A sorting domain-containing protein, partial [Cyclobacteriaceae bacterium]|nr:T9SS type A sorting domain-containing protein [Cyclobacteriaceae bacterium]
EVWVSDGTLLGTQLLKDISPGSDNTGIYWATEFNGKLLFVAQLTNGNQLWISDGTTAGTSLVYDFGFGWLQSMTVIGSNVWFYGEDNNGAEPWITDGTTAGTHRVMDVNPGSASSLPSNFTALGSMVLFVANTNSTGYELWRSDGTGQGTSLVWDVNYGPSHGSINYLTKIGSHVYFMANDGVHGVNIWRTDGTDCTTYPVTNTDNLVLTTDFFIPLGDNILFAALSPANGTEMYSYNTTQDPAFAISPPVITRGGTPDAPLFGSNFFNGNQWYLDGVAIDAATNKHYTPTEPGKYTVKVNISGCESAPSNAICVDPPQPTASLNIADPSAPLLTSSFSGPNQWFLNGTAIPSATTATYQAAAQGDYTVEAIVKGCPSPPSDPITLLVTGLERNSKMALMYPNPASEVVTIYLPGTGPAALQITSVDGRLMEQQQSSGGQTIQIPVQHYGAGLYLVRVKSSEGIYYGKLIKR